MRNHGKKKITVGVEDTRTLRIPLKPGLSVLKCISGNAEVLECTHDRTTVSITGLRPGVTTVCVIIGANGRPAMQLVYAVRVVEQDEE
ncbi:hypothetical protein FE782_25900 [Paenibacillus antri]|uniref:Uncharacterized protein n=1 Tax=Paenibacillus antri TaxID=2582848 RepID=A0A5R9FZ08_9BACL|nr:hypothetical protein [Paenibacillus antri]TLS49292.1 hypothetical protein FE782_25900 [Paenibacillus antri]